MFKFMFMSFTRLKIGTLVPIHSTQMINGIEFNHKVEMPEMVSFQKNAFQSSFNASFKPLRDDLDLIDVTLVCDDGQKMGAHQVRYPKNVYYSLFLKFCYLPTPR